MGITDNIEKSPDISLHAPLQHIAGIGAKRAAMLAALGLHTVNDLLFHWPREYRDRSRIQKIAEISLGETVTVAGEITASRSLRLRGGKSMAIITVRDESGSINATFFGRGFLAHTAFKRGTRLLLTGRVSEYKGMTLQNPEYEAESDEDGAATLHTGRIVPLYPLTDGISQRQLQRWIFNVLGLCAPILSEILPERLVSQHGFPDRAAALMQAHFPDDMETGEKARRRFAYEELLAMQLGILMRRVVLVDETPGMAHRTDGALLTALRRSLPFDLTAGQKHAVDDILGDMAASRPMFRLLQGDVGCGKTLVALHAVAAAVDSGSQVAFMAPTEILSEQHYLTLREVLAPLGVETTLLTGSTARPKKIRDAIADGTVSVVVGTHALFQKQTAFHHLGLVIIDEQHRFGVAQREALAGKGAMPDILHTTATPIPRTLAITLYGGMDISVIPDMPLGRLPVKTAFTPDGKKDDLYRYIHDQAKAGYQTYIVCPLVEESEHFSELTPLIDHYVALSQGPLLGLRCDLLHGRLDPREKEEVMRRFKAGDIDVLFATTVIEVGVDSPTATTIVIEDAGRFGLTQLHQLRGRVGRGTVQSWCFLLGKPSTPEGRQRLELLRTCDNGFDIAEADLNLRGPGDYCGARQAGLPDFRAADLLRDTRLLDEARRDAADLLQNDPALAAPEYAALATAVRRFDGMFT